tara:strand:+ start:28 stop:453 length:426 start_codon:yes stop_codon:yes gene_type:complete
MFKFFTKNEKKKSNETEILSKTASLLIHTAKIDENYTDKEKSIIERTLIEMGVDKENLDQLMKIAEKNEENSNQIIDFTKDLKGTDEDFKVKLIKSLWKIIYSDKDSDIYETNLIRRLSGLLYLDNKLIGNIKEEVKKELI